MLTGVLNELIIFWQSFLYAVNGVDGDGFVDSTFFDSISNWFYDDFNHTALGQSFQDFIFQFFEWLPHMLTFLTLGLAIFLFCFMMYKIIKLFTNTI